MTEPTWTADNGNGTYTNPLFYEEFSDPDIIRVGDDFFMTGTTMHTMPGLPVLKSRDLVNWDFLTYAFDVLDLGPSFRLEDGEIYGQGIWAPCLRHHDGKFHIFANINKHLTQIFTATDPAGPWTRREMKQSLHDLSVLFDDDGKAYVVWGYNGLRLAQLTDDLTDLVPGSEIIIVPENSGMGEGCHFYKFHGRYFITSAWFEGRMRMPAARADRIEGPWEVNHALSSDEGFGLNEGYRMKGGGLPFTARPPFTILPPNTVDGGRLSLHQGGIIETPAGEWWGWSMMDFNSLGRLTCLSPVTWQDGWPYFGLPGNLRRTPRTWIKPKATAAETPRPLFHRDDSFDGPALNPLWQWNHVPVPEKWSLAERPGHLRLHTMHAPSFIVAHNTLTQRAIGPVSAPMVTLDASGLVDGDIAGLALLGLPFRWIGVRRVTDGFRIAWHDQQTGRMLEADLQGPIVKLRADCNFMSETATLSYATGNRPFTAMGEAFPMVYQLKTFQGIRYSLFAFNTKAPEGGHADFDDFTVEQPFPSGLVEPIPYGQMITLEVSGHRIGPVRVIDRGLGRVALEGDEGVLTVAADGSAAFVLDGSGDAASFQWMETFTGEIILMSLLNHRFLQWNAANGTLGATSAGPRPDRQDGVRFEVEDA